MLSNIMIFAILVLILLCIIYFRYCRGSIFGINTKQDSSVKSQHKLYESKIKDEVTLSEDEKMEISWQFLYDITNYVLKKFSKKDVSLVHDIGKTLVGFGMIYNHVVDYGIGNRKKDISKAISEENNKNSKKQIAM